MSSRGLAVAAASAVGVAGGAAALANFVPVEAAVPLGVAGGLVGLWGASVVESRTEARRLQQAWAAACSENLDQGTDGGRAPGGLPLLSPVRRVVPFNRVHETARLSLVRWCLTPSPADVRVARLQGQAGCGKSRLALEVADDDRLAGWRRGWVRPDRAEDAVAVALQSPQPVLLIIDDVDVRHDVHTALARALATPPLAPVRVVCLAREGSVWWRDLLRQLPPHVGRELLSQREIVHVGPLAVEPTVQRQVFQQALRRFGAELGVQVTADVPVELRGFGADTPPLLLHAAALVIAQRLAQGASAPGELHRADVLRELLTADEPHWAAAWVDDSSPPNSVLRTALALALLVGSAESDLADLLRHVPGLSRADDSIRSSVLVWLRLVYPDAVTGTWVTPQLPPAVGEYLAVTVLAANPGLLAVLGRHAHADRALTVLVRACRDDQRAQELVSTLVGVDPARLLRIAFALARRGLGPVDASLAAVVESAPLTVEDIAALEAEVPQPSLALRHTCVALARRRVDAATDEWTLVVALRVLGVRLIATGGTVEARDVLRRAVDLSRQADVTTTDALRLLADCLTDYGGALRELGEQDAAVAAVEEAVAHERELVQRDRAGHLRSLAGALNNLAGLRPRAEDPHAALETVQEAVSIYRELVQLDRDQHLPALAPALFNLGIALGGVGRQDEALRMVEESVALQRELVGWDRDAHALALSEALIVLAARLAAAERPREAVTAAEEAVSVLRDFVASYPEAHEKLLAGALINLSNSLLDVGRVAEALEAATESVTLYRRLMAGNRKAYLGDLAVALNSLALVLRAKGRSADFLSAVDEALTLLTEVASTRRGDYLSTLAVVRSNQAEALIALGGGAEAVRAAGQSVDLYRELAGSNPDVHRVDLLLALERWATLLRGAGRSGEAERVELEVSQLYAELPEGHRRARGGRMIPSAADAASARPVDAT